MVFSTDKPVAAAESSQENEPVNHPLIKRRLTDTFLEEEECTSAQMWGGKVVSLFSPVLRFFTGIVVVVFCFPSLISWN